MLSPHGHDHARPLGRLAGAADRSAHRDFGRAAAGRPPPAASRHPGTAAPAPRRRGRAWWWARWPAPSPTSTSSPRPSATSPTSRSTGVSRIRCSCCRCGRWGWPGCCRSVLRSRVRSPAAGRAFTWWRRPAWPSTSRATGSRSSAPCCCSRFRTNVSDSGRCSSSTSASAASCSRGCCWRPPFRADAGRRRWAWGPRWPGWAWPGAGSRRPSPWPSAMPRRKAWPCRRSWSCRGRCRPSTGRSRSSTAGTTTWRT